MFFCAQECLAQDWFAYVFFCFDEIFKMWSSPDVSFFDWRSLWSVPVEESQLVVDTKEEVLHTSQCGCQYPEAKRLKAVDFFLPPMRIVEHEIANESRTLIRAAGLLPIIDAVAVKVLSKVYLILWRANLTEKLDELLACNVDSNCS